MRRIGSLELLAITTALTAKCEAESQYSRREQFVSSRSNPQPEHKRKKCKSCSYCGSHCNLYYYKGKPLLRYSKPNYSACSDYTKKKR